MRLRAPNRTVAAALRIDRRDAGDPAGERCHAGSEGGKIDGIVTNWGNPLPGFNDYMKHHTDIAFYTSAFFVVMNRQRFASLPADVRAAIDELSNERLVARFGQLWNKWDKPVREGGGSRTRGHRPGRTAVRAQWRVALQPATDRYLDGLVSSGFADAHATYNRLSAFSPR